MDAAALRGEFPVLERFRNYTPPPPKWGVAPVEKRY